MKNVLKIIYALIEVLPVVSKVLEMFRKDTDSNKHSEVSDKPVE